MHDISITNNAFDFGNPALCNITWVCWFALCLTDLKSDKIAFLTKLSTTEMKHYPMFYNDINANMSSLIL